MWGRVTSCAGLYFLDYLDCFYFWGACVRVCGKADMYAKRGWVHYVDLCAFCLAICNTHCNTHCNTLQHTLQHTLQYTATRCVALSFVIALWRVSPPPTYCNTLQHTATHCSTFCRAIVLCLLCGGSHRTLQHTATCTLQYTATQTSTHCNTVC